MKVAEKINVIAEKFAMLGFKEYEARILAALLIIGPATAREIYELANVPRPKVYETLKSLANKGYIEIQYGKPLVFVPLSQETLIERLRSSYNDIIDSLVKDLREFVVQRTPKPIYALTLIGENSALFKLREVLSRAKKEVKLVVSNPKLLLAIKSILKAICERGVKVDCVLAEYDREVMREIKGITEIYVLDLMTIPTVFRNLIARIREQEHLILAANIDRNEVYFMFRAGEVSGVWIKVKAVAEVQAFIMDTILGRIRT